MTEQEGFERAYLDAYTNAKELPKVVPEIKGFEKGWDAALEWASSGQEPVHFRAVIEDSQRNLAEHVVPFVVGFTEKRAAEQFILEQRDFKGWKYNLEALYTHPAPAQPVRLSEDEVEIIRLQKYAYAAPADHFHEMANTIQDAMLAKGAEQAVVAEKATSQTQPTVAQQEWSLDQEQAKFLADYILSDPDEPTAITLSVGFVKDDDGNVEHGLRLIDTEYPEEGAVMLVESEPNDKQPAMVQQLVEVLREIVKKEEQVKGWLDDDSVKIAVMARKALAKWEAK